MTHSLLTFNFRFSYEKSLYLCPGAGDERLLGIERHLDGADCGIAARRSRVSADLDDGARLLMLPDDVGLPVAVRDDEGDVPVLWHVVERLEPQRGLLYPAVIVVGGYCLAGGHTLEADRDYVGKYADGQPCEVLVHDLALQPFGWHIADGLDAWK